MIAKLMRITAAPMIMRVVVFAAALVALVSAAPSEALGPRVLLLLGVVSLLPAVRPGSRFTDVVMLLAVGFWMAATLGLGQSVSAGGTFFTACALYVLHSSAALAAVLPYDSVVDSAVILRWAARAGLVIGVSGAVTALIVLTVPSVTAGSSVLLLFAGLAAAAAVLVLLTRAARLKNRQL